MNQDRNFDDLADKFAKNIYGSEKGDIREVVMWRDLEEILSNFPKNKKLHILDAGGGMGQLSQKMAKLGHKVTLCDISEKMLDKASQDIGKNGLQEQFELIHSPVQNIGEYLTEPVDIILLHAVVEWLTNPDDVVKYLAQFLQPQGIFSLMFYNHTGLEFKNLICGNIPHVIQGMPHRRRFKLQPKQAFKPQQAYQWMSDAELQILGKSGVRCIHDYIGNRRVGEYTFDELLSMELALCQQEPYLSLGRYIHVWGKRAI